MMTFMLTKEGGLYLRVLRSHGRRIMVLRWRLHGHVRVHVGMLHVGSARHGAARLNPTGLWRTGIAHVARLRLESRGHASTLTTRTAAVLVVGRITHLVIILGGLRVEASSTSAGIGSEAASTLAVT